MTTFERAYYESESFWSGDALNDSPNQRRYAETAALIPAQARSLIDVGCGNGRFGAYVQATRPDIRIVSMDRSEAALRHVKTEKLLGEASKIPVEDHSFDCLTCLEVIEHLNHNELALALREFARVAGRYIIIGVPYKERIEKKITECPACKTRFNVDLHLRSFDETTMAQLFPSNIFQLTQTIFPGSGKRLLGIDRLIDWIAEVRRSYQPKRFMSPICPLCGYAENHVKAPSVTSSTALRLKSAIKLALSCGYSILRPTWPSYEAKGYWIACLYERVSGP
jgi:SAM-dependent methyltransferase